LIGTWLADYIRASGHGTARIGRKHDLHPTASYTPNSSCNAGVVQTSLTGVDVGHGDNVVLLREGESITIP
jgi:hypothetical protein